VHAEATANLEYFAEEIRDVDFFERRRKRAFLGL
jgi:hypothetical protein